MKIKIIIFTIVLAVVGIISVNMSVSNDNSTADICLENIEALGSGEGGNSGAGCRVSGGMCMTFDGNGNTVWYPGMSVEL